MAGAVNQEIEKRKITISPVKNFSALPGNGLLGEIDGVIVMGGNYRFISEHTADKEELKIFQIKYQMKERHRLFCKR